MSQWADRECGHPGCTKTIPGNRYLCKPHFVGLSMSLKQKLMHAYRYWSQGHEGSIERLRAAQAEVTAWLQAAAGK